MGHFSFQNCYFINTENESVLISRKWPVWEITRLVGVGIQSHCESDLRQVKQHAYLDPQLGRAADPRYLTSNLLSDTWGEAEPPGPHVISVKPFTVPNASLVKN